MRVTFEYKIQLSKKMEAESALIANRNITITEVNATKPQATMLSYLPKQKEFLSFCLESPFSDGPTVTENKLLLFLRTKVVGRPLKRGNNDPNNIRTLGHKSIEQYCAAIVDLWATQTKLMMNSNPNPRLGSVMSAYLSSLSVQEHTRQRHEYVDKGFKSLTDGVKKMDEVYKIADEFMQQYDLIISFIF